MWRLVPAILLPLAFGAQYPFSATLSKDSFDQPIYQLQWTFDVVQQTITFNVLVKTTGWVGFGLSPNGGMVGSDVVTGWVNDTGAYLQVSREPTGGGLMAKNRFTRQFPFHPCIQDRYALAQALPPIDPSQDWLLLSGNAANDWTNLTFTRKWVTGDSRDRDVMVRVF